MPKIVLWPFGTASRSARLDVGPGAPGSAPRWAGPDLSVLKSEFGQQICVVVGRGPNDRGEFVERVIGGAIDTLNAWREAAAPAAS